MMPPYYSYSPWSKDHQLVIDVLEEWFQAIEAGTANDRMPDPFGKRYSPEQCDGLIQTIDEYMSNEITRNPSYWMTAGLQSRGKPIDTIADFNRLQGSAREAFAQAVYGKIEELKKLYPPDPVESDMTDLVDMIP